QLEQAGEVDDHLRDFPDHLAEIPLLANLAVHLQPDSAGRRVADLAGGNQLGAGRGLLEGLADLPGAAGLLRLALQVAPRHVERNAVAPDAIERLVERDVLAALA